MMDAGGGGSAHNAMIKTESNPETDAPAVDADYEQEPDTDTDAERVEKES